jgi:hypothetical protein
MTENSQAKLAQAVKHLRDNLPAQLELQVIKARVMFALFQSLKAEGFTPEEALHIVSNTRYP